MQAEGVSAADLDNPLEATNATEAANSALTFEIMSETLLNPAPQPDPLYDVSNEDAGPPKTRQQFDSVSNEDICVGSTSDFAIDFATPEDANGSQLQSEEAASLVQAVVTKTSKCCKEAKQYFLAMWSNSVAFFQHLYMQMKMCTPKARHFLQTCYTHLVTAMQLVGGSGCNIANSFGAAIPDLKKDAVTKARSVGSACQGFISHWGPIIARSADKSWHSTASNSRIVFDSMCEAFALFFFHVEGIVVS